MNNHIDIIPKNEWDKLIGSILRPFLKLKSADALLSPEDFQQEAWLSLVIAASKFDPTRGTKFTTFACYYIRMRLLTYIIKSLKNKPTQIDDDPTEVFDFVCYDDMGESNNFVETVLEKINDKKHAMLIYDYFIKGKSLRTIAKEEGVSQTMIGNRIHKLLDALRIRMSYENA